MPGTTSRGAIPFPLGGDPPDTDGDMRKIAERVAAVFALYAQGPIVDRPVAGTVGRFYYATDEQTHTYDTGSAWVDAGGGGGSYSRSFLTMGA